MNDQDNTLIYILLTIIAFASCSMSEDLSSIRKRIEKLEAENIKVINQENLERKFE